MVLFLQMPLWCLRLSCWGSPELISLDNIDVQSQVEIALDEDLGLGDRTAELIPAESVSRVKVISREAAVVCGVAWFNEVFRQLDEGVVIDWHCRDGDSVAAGDLLCELHGNTRALLSGERSALNYLQVLSGTATLARRYADAVAGTGVRILDTRKTLPGLRLQQKYAVTCGGCDNHRIGLFDAILIKENHIRAAGSVAAAVEKALVMAPDIEVEVEVESLAELDEALAAGARRVLLDNFTLADLRAAVSRVEGKVRLEASGGVNLSTIRAIAETGVDDISVGAITKDVVALDLSMQFMDE